MTYLSALYHPTSPCLSKFGKNADNRSARVSDGNGTSFGARPLTSHANLRSNSRPRVNNSGSRYLEFVGLCDIFTCRMPEHLFLKRCPWKQQLTTRVHIWAAPGDIRISIKSGCSAPTFRHYFKEPERREGCSPATQKLCHVEPAPGGCIVRRHRCAAKSVSAPIPAERCETHRAIWHSGPMAHDTGKILFPLRNHRPINLFFQKLFGQPPGKHYSHNVFKAGRCTK